MAKVKLVEVRTGKVKEFQPRAAQVLLKLGKFKAYQEPEVQTVVAPPAPVVSSEKKIEEAVISAFAAAIDSDVYEQLAQGTSDAPSGILSEDKPKKRKYQRKDLTAEDAD